MSHRDQVPSRPTPGLTQPPIQWVTCPFPRLKRLGCEADHSPLSNADIKKEWSYIVTPSIYLHGMDRDNFIFYSFCDLQYNILNTKIL